MRTVYTNHELPHVWAHQTQQVGRGNHFFFDGPTIYSYGGHFPIATHVKNRRGDAAVLFTTRGYSTSTAKHLSYTRFACRSMRVFHVPLSADNLSNTLAGNRKTFLDDYQTRIKAAELSAGRSRKYADSALEALCRLVDEANDYAEFTGSPRRFTIPDLEQLRERAKHATARERERKRTEQAKLERVNADAIREWLSGERNTLPYTITRTYLRIVDDGANVETSKGAIFPVEHAKRGLAFVESIRESGQPYQRNGHTFHLGNYAIDKIDTSGNVTAGCHFVEYAEIARIAEFLR